MSIKSKIYQFRKEAGLTQTGLANAAGIGLADFVHDRLLAAMDWEATSVNVITSLMPANARVPLHFPTDRQALAVALQTSGRHEPREARVVWIKNTLSCQTVLASEAYLPEARARPDLQIEGEPNRLALDGQGRQLSILFTICRARFRLLISTSGAGCPNALLVLARVLKVATESLFPPEKRSRKPTTAIPGTRSHAPTVETA